MAVILSCTSIFVYIYIVWHHHHSPYLYFHHHYYVVLQQRHHLFPRQHASTLSMSMVLPMVLRVNLDKDTCYNNGQSIYKSGTDNNDGSREFLTLTLSPLAYLISVYAPAWLYCQPHHSCPETAYGWMYVTKGPNEWIRLITCWVLCLIKLPIYTMHLSHSCLIKTRW